MNSGAQGREHGQLSEEARNLRLLSEYVGPELKQAIRFHHQSHPGLASLLLEAIMILP